MTAETEIKVEIGKSYPEGNRKGQKGEPIFIKVEPSTLYLDVVGEKHIPHIPMEFNPRTGKSTKINIPQF